MKHEPDNMAKLYFLICLFTSIPYLTYSQRITASVPSEISYPSKESLAYLDQNLENDIKSLNIDSKPVRKEVEKVYKDRVSYVKDINESGWVVNDPKINGYYQRILNTIIEANPSINKDITLLVVRYSWPNAVCFGNGVLMINMGIINQLENESQIAFVIAHEIAHHDRDHVNEAILNQATLANSYKIKEGIKNAEQAKVGAKTALANLLLSFTYSSSKHSRSKESEADSLAVRYIKNTLIYDPNQSARTMDILDSIDFDFYSRNLLNFRFFFDSLSIPYNYSWELYGGKSTLQKMVNKKDFEIPDSVKTHPECKVRKQAMLRQTSSGIKTTNVVVNPSGDAEFMWQVKQAHTDVINAFYADSIYGSIIYKSMEMSQVYPNDAFPCMMIAICLAGMNIHMRERTLGKVLGIPKLGDDTSYDRLLAFLNELNKKDCAALGYYYLRKNVGKIDHNEEYLFSMFITSYAFDKLDEAKIYKELYIKDFKKGKYLPQINKYSF